MRPAKFTEFPDDSSRSARPGPVAVPSLPVNAIAAEADPTLEIRNLIEQLQQSARDARTQVQQTERERDEINRQLEQAIHQTEELRARERDQRTKFTEITGIIRERDAATAETERAAQALVRMQEQISVLVRERDEFRSQRDEVQHRLDGLTRTYSESGMRVNELQKQLNTIRLARDSAHSQNTELSTRLSAQGDEIAELNYQRDQARRTQQQTAEEAAAYKAEVEQLQGARSADSTRIEQLTTQLDEQRRKFLDLAEQKSAITQAGNEHAIALAEARSQVGGLTQERDTARLLAQTQSLEIEKLRAEFHAYRELGNRATADELNALRERLVALENQAREARHAAANLRQENIALVEKLANLEVIAEDATAHQEESELQMLTVNQQAEANRLELQKARVLIHELSAERETIHTHAEEARQELEAQLVALRSQAARVPDEAASNPREMQYRFEKQRLHALELGAQLETAQRNIRELSASLAEARLQVKFALGPRPAPGPKPGVPVAPQPVLYSEAAESLSELVPSLRESFEDYARSPGESGALLQLHDRVVTYSQRARVANCIAIHRLAQAFASLLESLAATPGQVNVSTLHTIRQAVEFFVFLRNEPSPERFTDPARARVLMVDDDEGNCQCVQLVMQERMIQTAVSFDPTSALLELASEPFDLVLLDVNMPDMSGFELCKRLRELPMHGQTPVVFLTGLATEERREQSILAGGNDFLGKPFNLHELTVKALLLIVQKQIAAAPALPLA